MSAPKVGDRVRVEFEGRVTQVDARDRLDVLPLDADENSDEVELVLWARVRHCTVLAPPVKVGDVVTAENVGQLAARSAIAEPGRPVYEAVETSHGAVRWHGTDGGVRKGDEFSNAVVLRIGDGQS